MPIKLSLPSFSTMSYGKAFVRSSSSATGATSPSANSRTVRRISSWSGDRSKSMPPACSHVAPRMDALVSRRRLILDFLTRGKSHRYGPHGSQRADLYLPLGAGPHPGMVLVHGGSWHKRYGKVVMRGLAGDLIRRGWAVWNIEYRRLEDGGGCAGTC